MENTLKEKIAEYMIDVINDHFDGDGLVVTDGELLESAADNLDYDYLANEIFKQDKVDEVLKKFNVVKGYMEPIATWKPEVQEFLDAMKDLENK